VPQNNIEILTHFKQRALELSLKYAARSLKNCCVLTLNLPTTTIVAPPSNASKWQMGYNSAFKGLKIMYECLMMMIQHESKQAAISNYIFLEIRVVFHAVYLYFASTLYTT